MLHCSVSDDSLGEHCSACLELHEVQSKIRECKELLDKLYIQEAHAKSSVNAEHDPIIRRFPLELVTDIFTLSNPSPAERGSPLLGDTPVATQRFQFSLGTVCAAWRNIVRSTPQLWTNIWIRLQIRGELPQMEFLLLSLRLSGSLPLHIYACVPQPHEPLEEDYPMLLSLLEVLNDHSERWKTLDLCLTSRLMSQITGVSPGSPNLEQLRIRPAIPNQIGSPFRLSFGLPSPRIVNAHEIPFQSIGIGWKNTTHFRLGLLTVGECLELFRQATQLEDFVVSFLCGNPEPFESGKIVTVPHLTSWSVKFAENSDVLLRKIRLPSLVHLQVEMYTSYDSLEHLLTCSNCPLRTICLNETISEYVDVIPIFRATPLLEKVVLFYATSPAIHELLDILARTKVVDDLSQDPFLPHLKSLSLIEMEYYPPPWHLVPSLFPPTQQAVNVKYRPLQKLEFLLSIGVFGHSDYLNKDIVLQLVEIRRRDYDLIIWNDDYDADGDFIQVSCDHHFGGQIDTADHLGVE